MTISIQLEITKEEADRCIDIIRRAFEQGLFNVRNGKVIFNFDSDGTLQGIRFEVDKWKRGKDSLKTAQLYEQAKIELKDL
jgi:hypothetical protein